MSHSPTLVIDDSRPGDIVGTPEFMSPEQARGKETDRRTDIWAFGCVLFEMLTGKRAFAGETVPDVLLAILDREPGLGRPARAHAAARPGAARAAASKRTRATACATPATRASRSRPRSAELSGRAPCAHVARRRPEAGGRARRRRGVASPDASSSAARGAPRRSPAGSSSSRCFRSAT